MTPPQQKARPKPSEIMNANAAAYIIAVNRDIPLAPSAIVLSTISMWARELVAVDRELLASYLLSLSVLASAESTKEQRATADRKRIESYDQLVAAAEKIRAEANKKKIITPGSGGIQ